MIVCLYDNYYSLSIMNGLLKQWLKHFYVATSSNDKLVTSAPLSQLQLLPSVFLAERFVWILKMSITHNHRMCTNEVGYAYIIKQVILQQ